jgi:type II secretory pathway pseudopilin PulG
MRRRGYSLLEALLTISIVLIAFVPLVTTFLMSSRQATHSRNGALANVVVYNLQQEIKDHRYGTPRPREWGSAEVNPDSGEGMQEQVVPAALEGKPVDLKFHYSVTVAPAGKKGNGSFFGNGTDPFDVLQIDVRWIEPTGLSHSGALRKVRVYLTVWREGDVVSP